MKRAEKDIDITSSSFISTSFLYTHEASKSRRNVKFQENSTPWRCEINAATGLSQHIYCPRQAVYQNC